MHANDVPLALRAPEPECAGDLDARLAELGSDLADAMVLYGLGRLGAGEYARRARRLKDEREGLERLRARFA